MRAGLTVALLAVLALPWPARAQSDAGAPLEIPVHRAVTTVLHLPDEVELARFSAMVTGLMRATTIDNRVLIRANRRAPAGTNVGLEVRTATVRRRFRLRVVRRAGDAWRDVVVLAPEAERAPAGAKPDTEQAGPPAAPAAPPTEQGAEPDTEQAAPPTVHAGPATRRAAPTTGRVTTAAQSQSFELTVHAVAALPGFTALEISGYASRVALQAHGGLGLRLVGAHRDSWWAVEANIRGERPAGPMTYQRASGEQLELRGSWLSTEVGLRARLGTMWMPSAYAGIGGQMHLRRSRTITPLGGRQTSDTMADGLALALGVGLHRRIGDVLLGLDFQMRRGGPDEYRSVTALWTVGYVLDLGE